MNSGQEGSKNETNTLITRVEVSTDDERFKNPSKPVGSFFTPEKVEELKSRYDDWHFKEDSGRGFRRVVPSPLPISILEINAIKDMVEQGYIVIACGGGGIPVVKTDAGYEAVDAVIDKDLTSAMLSEKLNAKHFIISTGVSHVSINYGKPNEKTTAESHPVRDEAICNRRSFCSGEYAAED